MGFDQIEDAAPGAAPRATAADRLKRRYLRIGEAQGHRFGEGEPGSPAPDFNLRTARPRPLPGDTSTARAETGDSGALRRRQAESAPEPPPAPSTQAAAPDPATRSSASDERQIGRARGTSLREAVGQPLSPSLVRENATRMATGVPVVIAVVALAAQVYLPLHVRTLGLFDLPLLVVAYLALLGRRPIVGTADRRGGRIGAGRADTWSPAGSFRDDQDGCRIPGRLGQPT